MRRRRLAGNGRSITRRQVPTFGWILFLPDGTIVEMRGRDAGYETPGQAAWGRGVGVSPRPRRPLRTQLQERRASLHHLGSGRGASGSRSGPARQWRRRQPKKVGSWAADRPTGTVSPTPARIRTHARLLSASASTAFELDPFAAPVIKRIFASTSRAGVYAIAGTEP